MNFMSMSKNKPLSGKRVLITRAKEQSEGLAKRLKELGADVIEFPTIEIIPPTSWLHLDQAIKNLNRFDWIIFTSVNGVKFFFERFKIKRGSIFPYSLKVCAIGPATAKELKARKIRVDYIPKKFIAESILEGFKKKKISGKRILIARAKKARDILPKGLREMGAEVEVVETYRTIKPKGAKDRIRKILKNDKIDVITFSSSSTVSNFVELLKGVNINRFLKNTLIACIGPVTAKTARDLGLRVDILPKRYTIPALTYAIAKYFDPSFNKKV